MMWDRTIKVCRYTKEILSQDSRIERGDVSALVYQRSKLEKGVWRCLISPKKESNSDIVLYGVHTITQAERASERLLRVLFPTVFDTQEEQMGIVF